MNASEPSIVTGTEGEQTRAAYPIRDGYVEREGVRIFWELYGQGDRTVLFLPTWSIIHSRTWKAQIPDFARRCRVLTFDGRGNGRSDRPEDPSAYAEEEFAADALAVMDAAETPTAAIVAFSMGARRALILAANHPDRIERVVFIGPSVPLGPPRPERAAAVQRFWAEQASPEGWAKYNSQYWLTDYPDFLDFFFSQVFSEPHSTKQIADCASWGLETSGEILVAGENAPEFTEEQALELCGRVTCPVLVIHGGDDQVVAPQCVGQYFG